jgi:hypothetical protein
MQASMPLPISGPVLCPSGLLPRLIEYLTNGCQ